MPQTLKQERFIFAIVFPLVASFTMSCALGAKTVESTRYDLIGQRHVDAVVPEHTANISHQFEDSALVLSVDVTDLCQKKSVEDYDVVAVRSVDDRRYFLYDGLWFLAFGGTAATLFALGAGASDKTSNYTDQQGQKQTTISSRDWYMMWGGVSAAVAAPFLVIDIYKVIDLWPINSSKGKKSTVVSTRDNHCNSRGVAGLEVGVMVGDNSVASQRTSNDGSVRIPLDMVGSAWARTPKEEHALSVLVTLPKKMIDWPVEIPRGFMDKYRRQRNDFLLKEAEHALLAAKDALKNKTVWLENSLEKAESYLVQVKQMDKYAMTKHALLRSLYSTVDSGMKNFREKLRAQKEAEVARKEEEEARREQQAQKKNDEELSRQGLRKGQDRRAWLVQLIAKGKGVPKECREYRIWRRQELKKVQDRIRLLSLQSRKDEANDAQEIFIQMVERRKTRIIEAVQAINPLLEDVDGLREEFRGDQRILDGLGTVVHEMIRDCKKL